MEKTMLTYDLTKRGGKTKTLFIYERMKDDILSGFLAPGARLPSKRELAEHLGVSVITIENVYGFLEEEGYITSKSRVGFFVNDLTLPASHRPPGAGHQSDMTGSRSDMAALRFLKEETPPSAFSREETAYFPAMARIIRRLLSEKPYILQQRSPQAGCAVLRNAIADYLRRYRGMAVQPANIIIGSGAEYLYGLVIQLFGQGVRYGIESPSYKKIELVQRANGAVIDYLRMGSDGILTEELTRTEAKVLHVTPYHSFPTGVTASAEKRYEYLNWAARTGGFIVEDDYDSEYAFFRKPIDPLFSMDTQGRVIYMNTFTKTLSPAIRIAYMVLSDELMRQYDIRLGFYSCPVPVLDQYVLAEFINDGGFERHLSRIRRETNRAEKRAEAASAWHLTKEVKLEDY